MVVDREGEAKWERVLGLVGVRWDIHGSEWDHHMKERLKPLATPGSIGMRNRIELVPPRREYSVTGSNLMSVLEVYQLQDGGLLAVVTGLGEYPPDAQVNPWVEALMGAQADIGLSDKVFEWTAAVGPEPWAGPMPPIRYGRVTEVIDRELSIGPLRIYPAAKSVLEFGSARYEVFAPRLFGWVPVVVRGEAVGFDWHDVARYAAASDLYRLCGLLGLVHGIPWIVRVGAMQHGEGLSFPESMGTVPPGDVSSFRDFNEPERVPPPAWLRGAWGLIGADDDLRYALGAYQQGLQLVEVFPSQAGVMFVTAIETIGAALAKQAGAASESSRAKFKRGLRAAVPEIEATALEDMYGRRSGTAHSGRLYGTEEMFGLHRMPNWTPVPELEFEMGQLNRLKNATRQLLVGIFETS